MALINSIHCVLVLFRIFSLYLHCSYSFFFFVLLVFCFCICDSLQSESGMVWPGLVCLMAKGASQLHPFCVFVLLVPFYICICRIFSLYLFYFGFVLVTHCSLVWSGLPDGQRCFSAPTSLFGGKDVGASFAPFFSSSSPSSSSSSLFSSS